MLVTKERIPKKRKTHEVRPTIASAHCLKKVFRSWHRKRGLGQKPAVSLGGGYGARSAGSLKLLIVLYRQNSKELWSIWILIYVCIWGNPWLGESSKKNRRNSARIHKCSTAVSVPNSKSGKKKTHNLEDMSYSIKRILVWLQVKVDPKLNAAWCYLTKLTCMQDLKGSNCFPVSYLPQEKVNECIWEYKSVQVPTS